MKLKLLLKAIEKILGVTYRDGTPRADMYLPERLLAMALILLAGGTACAIYAVISHAVWAIVCAVLGLVFGLAAVLCWRNQTIHVLSEEQFTYTTMFGNTESPLRGIIGRSRKSASMIALSLVFSSILLLILPFIMHNGAA